MLRINIFLDPTIYKHRREFIIEICFETLNYMNKKICQRKNECDLC